MLLGKLEAVHDKRTLPFGRYAAKLPDPPLSCDRSKVDEPGKMYLNDTLGDCVVAAMANLDVLWDFFGSGENLEIPDSAVLTAYERISGWKPTGPDDPGPGCVMLNAMNYWRKSGLAGKKIHAFTGIHPGSINQIKLAIWLFGGVAAGFELPTNVLPGASGVPAWTKTNGRPNPNNGHGVALVGYDPENVWVRTWATIVPASWRFVTKYMDEGYAPLDRLWIPRKPSGFDFRQLDADLAALSAAA